MASSSRPGPANRDVLMALSAGAIVLLVVHTLGRFYYTPLLPYLVDDGLLDPQQAASLATWNYLGYLMGAMLAIRWHRIDHIRFLLPLSLAVHVLTTLLQTQVEQVAVLDAVRWLNGVANGVVFVQAPALILEWLVLRNRASMSGLVYLGVGIGLLMSSALVSYSADWLSGPGTLVAGIGAVDSVVLVGLAASQPVGRSSTPAKG